MRSVPHLRANATGYDKVNGTAATLLSGIEHIWLTGTKKTVALKLGRNARAERSSADM